MESDWKDPVWGSSIRVALGKPRSGWVQLAILVAARQQHVVISCSDVFNPFGALKHFLMQVATGNLPASFMIDEEGTEATLWAFASAQDTGLIEFFVTESNLMSQDECQQSARLKCRVSRQEFLHAFHCELSQWLKRDYEVGEFGGRYLDEQGRPECDLRQLWFGQFYRCQKKGAPHAGSHHRRHRRVSLRVQEHQVQALRAPVSPTGQVHR